MKRTAFFLFIALLPLAVVMAFVWRIDPAGYVYHGDAVRAALAHDPPCLISDTLVGQESLPAFKLGLFKRRHAKTIVIGTSRVLEMRARPGEQDFVNLGMPGTGIETLHEELARMHEVHPGPLTIYLGFDTFWLNRTWFPFVLFTHGFGMTFDYLASRQWLQQSWSLFRQYPDLLFHGWSTVTVADRCGVDRGGLLASGHKNAWEPDGSLDYNYQLVPSMRVPPDDDFTRDVATHSGIYYKNWNQLDPKRLVLLDKALAQVHSYGWRLTGYFVPYSPRYVKALSTDPQTATRWRELGRVVPAMFARHGFPFLDLRDVRSVPCAGSDFIDDGWHPNAACDARIRLRLDAAR